MLFLATDVNRPRVVFTGLTGTSRKRRLQVVSGRAAYTTLGPESLQRLQSVPKLGRIHAWVALDKSLFINHFRHVAYP